MIVDTESEFKFLITGPNTFSAKQSTSTFDIHVVPTMPYPYCIVLDRDTLFMLFYFQSWAACTGIKLEPSTMYYR